MSTITNWTDEDRSEIVEVIVDGMISEMTYEQMRQYVWDALYDDLLHQEWADIWMQAEQFAPELLKEFEGC